MEPTYRDAKQQVNAMLFKKEIGLSYEDGIQILWEPEYIEQI
jgi:hypothetical protein